MSSVIDVTSASAETSGADIESSRIIHFDATLRRKEKMRRQAAGENGTNGTHAKANGAESLAAPASSRPSSNGGAHVGNGGPARAAVTPRPAAAPVPLPKASSPTPAAAFGLPEAATDGLANRPSEPAPAAPEKKSPAATPLALNPAELEQFLINFVVEQTGYPPEMVELDADLEADLGIDSIKKAQLFGEMAETLNIQVEISDDMSLDDFPTLRHVLDFLDKAGAGAQVTPQPAAPPAPSAPAPQPAPAAQTAPAAQPAPAAPPAADTHRAALTAAIGGQELEEFLVNFVVEQTGYPPEMVELDADLEADLGIDSIKKAQLFGEMAENLNIQIEISDDMSLDDFPTLRHVLDFLQNGPVKIGGADESPAAPTAGAASSNGFHPAAAPVLEARQPAVAADGLASRPTEPAPSPTSAEAFLHLSPAELEQFLVNFVVEQTGYPPEMVELDADLEADLGIDSIKKAQLFGEMAETLNIQVEISDDMSLDDFPTLRHVMNFLTQQR